MRNKLLFLNIFQFSILIYGLIEKYLKLTNQINQAPCISMELFNFPCPVCGSTRSLIHLLNGELILSLTRNPLIIAFLIFVNVLNIIFILGIIQKKDYLKSIKVRLQEKDSFLFVIVFIVIVSSWINNILQL